MKVYCINCKHQKRVPDDCFGGGEIYCYRKTGKIITDYIRGDYKEYIYRHSSKSIYPNKRDTNGCKYYIRKWWKFWIKE